MFNIIIGALCISVAIFLMATSSEKEDAKFILFSTIIGVINLSMGAFLCLNKDTYIVTVNQKDGTSIEVEAKEYDISDGYIKIRQDDEVLYIYEVKDVKVTKKDK